MQIRPDSTACSLHPARSAPYSCVITPPPGDAYREPPCPHSPTFRSRTRSTAPARCADDFACLEPACLAAAGPRKGRALQPLRCLVLPSDRGAVRGRRDSGASDRTQRVGRDGDGARRRWLVRRLEQRADELRYLRNASDHLSQIRDGRALLPRRAQRSRTRAALASNRPGGLRHYEWL